MLFFLAHNLLIENVYTFLGYAIGGTLRRYYTLHLEISRFSDSKAYMLTIRISLIPALNLF